MKRTQKNFHRNILICVYGFFFVCILGGLPYGHPIRKEVFPRRDG